MDVNYLAVLLAALSAFVLGGIWYGPLFGKRWQRLVGLSDEQLKAVSPVKVYGAAFVLALIAAFVFALFLGRDVELGFAVGVGLAAGLCWVAASVGISYLFEQKPLGLFLINGGYFTLQYTLYGLVLGLMP